MYIPSLTDDNTDPKLKTEEGLRECSKEALDGRQLQNLEQYRATSNIFNMTVAEDNAFQSPGTFPAMADGFFVFLEPLPSKCKKVKTYWKIYNNNL